MNRPNEGMLDAKRYGRVRRYKHRRDPIVYHIMDWRVNFTQLTLAKRTHQMTMY